MYNTLKSHNAVWRDQTKSKGDVVKLAVIAELAEIRRLLEVEYDKIDKQPVKKQSNI